MNFLGRRCNNIRYNFYRCISYEINTKPQLICSKNILQNSLRSANLTPTCTFNYNAIRFKSKKQTDPDSDDESEVFDDDASLSRDSKIIKFNTTSLRTDAILKGALNIARNKIEKVFYESKIRVNGRKILKKSAPVRIDYEIDVIKSVSPKNPDHLYISRVEIMNLTANEDAIVVTARRFKTLLVENYQDDPYKASSSTDDK